MPRRKNERIKPQHAKSARTVRKLTYAELRAEAERFYRDRTYRDAMPWSEVPA